MSILRRTAPDVAARVPDLAKMIALRNILAHEYDRVRAPIVWRTQQVEVPALIRSLDALLKEAEPP